MGLEEGASLVARAEKGLEVRGSKGSGLEVDAGSQHEGCPTCSGVHVCRASWVGLSQTESCLRPAAAADACLACPVCCCCCLSCVSCCRVCWAQG